MMNIQRPKYFIRITLEDALIVPTDFKELILAVSMIGLEGMKGVSSYFIFTSVPTSIPPCSRAILYPPYRTCKT